MRALLSAGAPPAARDNWGYTPLHEAAAKGKVDVCIGEYIGLANPSSVTFAVSNIDRDSLPNCGYYKMF